MVTGPRCSADPPQCLPPASNWCRFSPARGEGSPHALAPAPSAPNGLAQRLNQRLAGVFTYGGAPFSVSLSLSVRTVAGDGAGLWSKRKEPSMAALFIATTARCIHKNRPGCLEFRIGSCGQLHGCARSGGAGVVGHACHSRERLCLRVG
jgi:hypothetical protein